MATLTSLFHVSGWQHLATLRVGDSFTLIPGPQHAEGVGVYFSESAPVPTSTAEGARTGVSAVVQITTSSSVGWWRTKASLARKFGRPRTWHSDGKQVLCRVVAVSFVDRIPQLTCEHTFA